MTESDQTVEGVQAGNAAGARSGRFLKILGIIFLVFLIGGVSCVSVVAVFGLKHDKACRAYLDSNVPQIVTSWDVEELIKQASPRLLNTVPREKVEALFRACRERLGPLQEYKGSKGRIHFGANSKEGRLTTGQYVAEARFEKAVAQISILVILEGSQWRIGGFYVNSDALLP